MKKTIIFLMALFMSLSMSAQYATQNSNFMDNWFVGLHGSASVPLSFNKVFPVNGGAGLSVGRWLTPTVGFEAEGTAYFGSQADADSRVYFDVPTRAGNHNVVRGVTVSGNVLLNLSNLFCDYKGAPRAFEVQTVTGLGWLRTLNAHSQDFNDLYAKTGVRGSFNLGKAKAWSVYVEPTVLWNMTRNSNTIKFNRNYGQFGVFVGVTYKFKNSNGTHNFVVWNVDAMNDEINALRAEVAELKSRPVETVTEVLRDTIVETVNNVTVVDRSEYVVYFAQGSDVLTDTAKEVLDNVSGPVSVVATASPEGSAKFNQALSERRAENVATYLRNRGVQVNDVRGLGVTGNESGRVAIVTVTR